MGYGLFSPHPLDIRIADPVWVMVYCLFCFMLKTMTSLEQWSSLISEIRNNGKDLIFCQEGDDWYSSLRYVWLTRVLLSYYDSSSVIWRLIYTTEIWCRFETSDAQHMMSSTLDVMYGCLNTSTLDAISLHLMWNSYNWCSVLDIFILIFNIMS